MLYLISEKPMGKALLKVVLKTPLKVPSRELLWALSAGGSGRGSGMEIKEMNYLIAIAEERSISGAAQRLFMAQSSLSQFLTGMEHELGCRLFVRTSTGVRPTEEGRLMIEYAYQMLSEYHRVRDRIQDVGELVQGRVIMGISTFRGSFLLPPVLNAFRLEYPKVEVKIIEENSMVLEQMLQNGELDLALIVLPAKTLRGEVEFLMRDEICLITREGHPVLQYAKPVPDGSLSQIPRCIDIRDAGQFEFLLSDMDTILGREARKIFRAHNMEPKAYNDKLSAFMAASMGAYGLGLAFTYYSSRHYYRNAEYLSLGEDGSFLELGLAMMPGRYHSKAAVALKETMKTIF